MPPRVGQRVEPLGRNGLKFRTHAAWVSWAPTGASGPRSRPAWGHAAIARRRRHSPYLDRVKFGPLVVFNNLGPMGIVADENGFYQASSSKGITYSPFAGYWASRIVGYRRLKPESGAMPEDNQ